MVSSQQGVSNKPYSEEQLTEDLLQLTSQACVILERKVLSFFPRAKSMRWVDNRAAPAPFSSHSCQPLLPAAFLFEFCLGSGCLLTTPFCFKSLRSAFYYPVISKPPQWSLQVDKPPRSPCCTWSIWGIWLFAFLGLLSHVTNLEILLWIFLWFAHVWIL